MEKCSQELRRIFDSAVPANSCRTITPIGKRVWIATVSDIPTPLILKLYDHGSSGFKREFTALQCIRRSHPAMSTPVIVDSGVLPSPRQHFILMRGLEGNTLQAVAASSGGGEHTKSLAIVANLLGEIHASIPGEDSLRFDPAITGRSMCENHLRIVLSFREYALAEIVRQNLKWLESYVVSTTTKTVFCHGDLHPNNIIAQMRTDREIGIVGIIDFEGAHVASPEFDVAKSVVVSSYFDGCTEATIVHSYSFAELCLETLRAFEALHAVDGWIYGRLLEKRYIELWDYRLRQFATRRM
jgi:aminoglycoside phosphotransferase (APT) family kinase protein